MVQVYKPRVIEGGVIIQIRPLKDYKSKCDLCMILKLKYLLCRDSSLQVQLNEVRLYRSTK